MSAKLEYIPTLAELQYSLCVEKVIPWISEEYDSACHYFIENFVKIEDRDSQGTAIEFKLWPKQREVLRDILECRLVQILKARQLGETWEALAYERWRAIFTPGWSTLALSKSEDDSKELVRRCVFILRHLPEWMIMPHATPIPTLIDIANENRVDIPPTWEATKESVTIHHPDKDGKHQEDSTFQSFSASENAGRSFTGNLLLLDEWAFQQWAREIWKAVFPAVNRPTGGQVIGLSTIERGTLFEDIWIGENDFKKIFLGWDADPRRDKEWYDRTKKVMNDDILGEYPATVEEAFLIPGGSFFPEFKKSVHLKPPIAIIPLWYKRFVMLDYGLDMLAAYWVYIDRRGFARVYREVYESNLIISKAAARLWEAMGVKIPEDWQTMTRDERSDYLRDNTQGIEQIEDWYAPPDLFSRRQETGKSAADIFDDCGIYLTQTSNDQEQGCRAMKEWLAPLTIHDEETGSEIITSALTIDETCAPNLARSLINIQKDKRNPNIFADQPHELTHAPKALQYFCSERDIQTVSIEPVLERMPQEIYSRKIENLQEVDVRAQY